MDKFDDLVADVESRIAVLENMMAKQREPHPAADRRIWDSDTADVKISTYYKFFFFFLSASPVFSRSELAEGGEEKNNEEG